ncbi:MAG TPA: copper resistance protein CopC [Acidimicrobiia bacterium]|nr:copper resistance protein CopC [Acidimicrobiia bacterium]
MVVRRFWLFATLVLVVLVPAIPTSAHAALVESSPSDGAHLDSAPAEVVVTFSEPVDPPAGAIRVYDTKRNRVDQGDSGSGDHPDVVEASLRPDLADGAYVATWHVVSLDGHPIRGAFVFHVGHASGPVDESLVAALLGEGGEIPFAVAGMVARWVTYVAGLIAAGAALFAWSLGRADAATVRLIRIAAAVGAVASLLQVPLFAAESTGLGSGAWSSGSAWGDAIGSPVGRAAAVRTLALLGVAVAARLPKPPTWVWVPAGGVIVAEVLTGHTLTTEPWYLVVIADLVHLAAVALWLGGLACLVLLVRSARRAGDPPGAASAVGQFSRQALWSVVALSLAGLFLAWAEVRTLSALTSTTYGWTLVTKTAVVVAVLAAATYNNRVLVPAITAEAQSGQNPDRDPAGSDAWSRLRRTIRFEVVGLVLVLGVTALLVNVQPAAEASGVTGPFSVFLEFGDGQVNLVVDPNRVGANQVHAYVLTATGAPAEATGEAILEFRLPAEEIGPIVPPVVVAGPGHWVYTGSDITIPGEWEITFRLATDFEELSATARVNINR